LSAVIQLIPSQSNRRSMVQWYSSPFSIPWTQPRPKVALKLLTTLKKNAKTAVKNNLLNLIQLRDCHFILQYNHI